ncbi:MAG: hypothetical protein FWB95_01340 [Treponema sp.]|nr:hypothetical protein [Treponema sp.]
MKLKRHLAVLLFFISAAFLQAQSAAAGLPVAEEIETLLAADAVTYLQAARFLLEASDAYATFDSQDAFRYAQEQKWLPKKADADDTARLDAISLLVMRSFGMKGGVMYSITKNTTALAAHYSYRELTAKKVIQGRTSPAMNVSGRQLLFITERMISQSGTED